MLSFHFFTARFASVNYPTAKVCSSAIFIRALFYF